MTLNPTVDWDTYWNFTFQDLGSEDIPTLTDFIIKQRADDECSRVTVLTHSTGITEVMRAAVVDPLMTTKVDRVVALSPCVSVKLDKFGIPLNDKPSIKGLGLLYDSFDLKSTWGPIFEIEVDQKVCPINTVMCGQLKAVNEICMQSFASDLSSKNLQHFVEMAAEQDFQEYIEMPALYPELITEAAPIVPSSYLGPLPLYGIFAGQDENCQ